jgi:hypothetical protein
MLWIPTMSDETQPPTLEYTRARIVGPLPPVRRSPLVWFALGCWFLPLVAGVSIATAAARLRPYRSPTSDYTPNAADLRFEQLENWGLGIIIVGTVLFLAGAISVLTFVIRRWGSSARRWREISLPALVLVGLLLSNFVVAVLMMIWAGR